MSATFASPATAGRDPGTSATPAASASVELVWTSVCEGLWTGTRDGELAGTIEFVDAGFEASNGAGEHIGRSHSLAGARRLVASPPPPVAERAAVSHERMAIALGWVALSASAAAAVLIATQLFV